MLGYVARRLLIMMPTLLAVSAISFVIIQLPPGDYLTTQINELHSPRRDRRYRAYPVPARDIRPRQAALAAILRLGRRNPPAAISAMVVRIRAAGAGRRRRPGIPHHRGDRRNDRIFIWLVAFPIGIYSATHQYSVGDYALTFLGFIGLATPNFLLALVLLYFANVSSAPRSAG